MSVLSIRGQLSKCQFQNSERAVFFASSELYIFLQVRLIARQFVVDHLYDGLGRKLHPNFHSIVARRDLDTLQ